MEGHRPGYAYRYRFSTDVEILSLYKEQLQFCYSREIYKCFVFETRTNFVLKSTGAEEIVDSERFASILPVYINEEELAMMSTMFRLLEYWMPLEEVEGLVTEAFYFSRQMVADPRNSSLRVIPIAVDIDVCTVQSVGEPLHATMNRSIKTDCLIPYRLHMFGPLNMVPSGSGEGMMVDEGLRLYCLKLPEYRVDDVCMGSLASMKCPICLRAPTFGAVLTTLPCDRNHSFHKHCIIRKLLLNKSCPLCPFKIVTE